MRTRSLGTKLFIAALVVIVFGLALAGPVAAQTPGSCGSTYIVQPGDYLAKIAATCGVDVPSLLAVNPQIAYPSTIYVGQVLVMPGGAPNPSAQPSIRIEPSAGAPGDTIYVIGSGFAGSREIAIGPSKDAETSVINEKRVTTQASGVFVSSITIPANAEVGSTLVVLAYEPGGDVQAVSPPFTVTSVSHGAQKLSITPSSGAPGTTVTVNGSGWPADTILRVGPARRSGGDITSDAQVTTGSDGSFSAAVVIPTNGTHGERWSVRAMIPGGALSTDSNVFVTLNYSSGPAFYVAQEGDTLHSIAEKLHIAYEALAAANPNILHSFYVYTGQLVNLPWSYVNNDPGWYWPNDPGWYWPANSNWHWPNDPGWYWPADPGQSAYYTVQPGDTLQFIALKHGSTWPALLALNPQITDASRVYVGQVLKVK